MARPFHKIKPEDVAELRKKYPAGKLNQVKAARKFGVNVRTIYYHIHQWKAL